MCHASHFNQIAKAILCLHHYWPTGSNIDIIDNSPGEFASVPVDQQHIFLIKDLEKEECFNCLQRTRSEWWKQFATARDSSKNIANVMGKADKLAKQTRKTRSIAVKKYGKSKIMVLKQN